MDDRATEAAIDALDRDETVRLVKQLVNIPSPEGEELECARRRESRSGKPRKAVRLLLVHLTLR